MPGDKKKIVLVADTFPPLRTSGAVQMRDLVVGFVEAGYDTTMVVPDSNLTEEYCIEQFTGATVLRVKAINTKNIGFFRRTIAELLLPYYLIRGFRRSPLAKEAYTGLVWYSPTIFLGAFAHWFMSKYQCKGYLIVRDIFPQWAVDMGLMSRWGLPHLFFKLFEQYQYRVATKIGVITPGVIPCFSKIANKNPKKVEVLYNWLSDAKNVGCSIDLSKSTLAGRKLIVYAGNMGVSQGIDFLANVVEYSSCRKDIGFVFVGRGLDAESLRARFLQAALDNVLVFDEIPPDEIPGLYAQCHIGALSLDSRHKTHNIPGKFLSYMQAGLPVVAIVNSGNDLIDLINQKQVGVASSEYDVSSFSLNIFNLVEGLDRDPTMFNRCRALFENEFHSGKAVASIAVGIS